MAAALLIGAMVFTVATKDSGHRPSEVASGPAVGSEATGDAADTSTPDAAPFDPETMRARVPSTEQVSVLTKPGLEDATWVLSDELVRRPGETEHQCSPLSSDGLGGYAREWSLVDDDGFHGSVMVRATEFESPEAASAEVAGRADDTYQSCLLDQQQEALSSSTGITDVEPPRIVESADTLGDQDAFTHVVTAEDYRLFGNPCIRYVSNTWQQYGSRVVQTQIETCGDLFEAQGASTLTATIDALQAQ